jgi:hypothetical protein
MDIACNRTQSNFRDAERRVGVIAIDNPAILLKNDMHGSLAPRRSLEQEGKRQDEAPRQRKSNVGLILPSLGRVETLIARPFLGGTVTRNKF